MQFMEDNNNQKMRQILCNFVREVYNETGTMSTIEASESSRREFISNVVHETFYTFYPPSSIEQKTCNVQIFGNYYKAAVGCAFQCSVFFDGHHKHALSKACIVTSGNSVKPVEEIVEQFESYGCSWRAWKRALR